MNKTQNNEIILSDVKIARNFFEKLFGKIFIKEALLIENCNSVHTFFIKENLDIYFLDKDNVVIKIFKNFQPNKIILPVKNAVRVLEIKADFIINDKIKTKDILQIL